MVTGSAAWKAGLGWGVMVAGGGATHLQLPTKVLFLTTAGGLLYNFGLLKHPTPTPRLEWPVSAVAQSSELHVKSHF